MRRKRRRHFSSSRRMALMANWMVTEEARITNVESQRELGMAGKPAGGHCGVVASGFRICNS